MKYIFTEEQFVVILALAGVSECRLFCSESEIGDEEIIRALVELYRTGRITMSEEKPAPAKEMQDILGRIGRAELVVSLDFADRDFSQHLIYAAGKRDCVILEKGWLFKKPVVKLWIEDAGYYIRDLIENGILPESMTTERAGAEAIEEAALQEKAGECGEEELLLRIRRMWQTDAGAEAVDAVDVLRGDVFTWMHVYGESGDFYHVYSMEELTDLLSDLLKGKEI